jgi:hypothetical protein
LVGRTCCALEASFLNTHTDGDVTPGPHPATAWGQPHNQKKKKKKKKNSRVVFDIAYLPNAAYGKELLVEIDGVAKVGMVLSCVAAVNEQLNDPHFGVTFDGSFQGSASEFSFIIIDICAMFEQNLQNLKVLFVP